MVVGKSSLKKNLMWRNVVSSLFKIWEQTQFHTPLKFLLHGKFKAIDYTSIWQISGEIVIFGAKPHVPFNSHIYKGIQRERGFWAQNPEIALNASNYV